MTTPSAHPLPRRERLHDQITRELALAVMRSERSSEQVSFPNEGELCSRLGVSRTVVRESMKVLADKGMVVIRPRAGTRATPRSEWNLLDPDILSWQAQLDPDPQLLQDLCEVRLAIEPTAAGFAAVRATEADLERIERCLAARERMAAADAAAVVELDLEFHTAVVDASHNALLSRLSSTIRQPLRAAVACASQLPATVTLAMDAHRQVADALRRRDPMAARVAAEQVVGLAMVAVHEATRSKGR